MTEDGIYTITCKMTNTSNDYFRLTIDNGYMNPHTAIVTVNGTTISGDFYAQPGTSTLKIDNAQLGKIENVGDLNHAAFMIYNNYSTIDSSPFSIESCVGIKK